MKLTASSFIMVLLALSVSLHAEEFDWSWEKNAEGEGQEPSASAESPAHQAVRGRKTEDVEQKAGIQPVAATEESAAKEAAPSVAAEGEGTFQWTKQSDDEESVEKETREAKKDTDAYDGLLKENLELRRRVTEALKAQEAARKDSERLAGQLKDVERRSAQFAALIEDLEKQKRTSKDDPERLKDLETRLAEAEREKTKMGEELKALSRAVEEQKKAPAVTAPPATEFTKPPSAGTEGVRPGSDLFKEKERENVALKEKLVEIETARRKSVKDQEDLLKKAERAEEEARQAGQKQRELEERLAATMAAQKESKKTIEKLLEQIPALEKELSNLKSSTTNKDVTLVSKERDLQAMEVELQKREQRLIKAERMTAVLEKAREDVAQVSDRERRDMHYNMAVVYTKEGKFREAEGEYLRALRIDPNDAAVHYNLGILYDDELNDKERAAMHYRKYLRLNPHGNDVDTVKGWLLKLEMGQ
jgi:Tfp pilus assembly protein PilF